MGLDIYVGPLSRYHAQNWKNLVQQYAEASGHTFQVVRPTEGEPASQEEVFKGVTLWKQALRDALHQGGNDIPDWDEDPAQDYETDRPGWEGWLGAILKAAYLRHPELEQPIYLPSSEDYWNDPAIRRSHEGPSLLAAFSQPELWLPGDFPFMFSVQTVAGKEAVVASVGGLLASLQEIVGQWGKTVDEILELPRDQPAPEATVDEHAAYGLGCFLRMGYEAQRLQLPMIVDY